MLLAAFIFIASIVSGFVVYGVSTNSETLNSSMYSSSDAVTSIVSSGCPAFDGLPVLSDLFDVGDPHLTNIEYAPYHNTEFISGTVNTFATLDIENTSQLTGSFTSSNAVEVFIYCAPVSGDWSPPQWNELTGYVFSTGAASAVSLDVTLPPGQYEVLVINPASSASTINLTQDVIATPTPST